MKNIVDEILITSPKMSPIIICIGVCAFNFSLAVQTNPVKINRIISGIKRFSISFLNIKAATTPRTPEMPTACADICQNKLIINTIKIQSDIANKLMGISRRSGNFFSKKKLNSMKKINAIK